MENLITELKERGYQVTVNPCNDLLQLLIKYNDKLVFTGLGKNEAQLFARAIAQLANDSLAHREMISNNNGLSQL